MLSATAAADFPSLTLILGGARSGKSAYAEQLAKQSAMPVRYLATARYPADDPEFQARIAHHRLRRPPEWTCVEASEHLAQTLQQHAAPGRCILVDCLTLWLNQVLFDSTRSWDEATLAPSASYQTERQNLLALLPQLPGKIILVSNEIGLGVIPMGEGTRLYVDELGRLNQNIAALANCVYLLVSGIPLAIKH